MVSSTSVYGQNRGEWVDEDSETRPTSDGARWLVAAEERIWEANEANCVVRFSGIYGPGRDWLLRRLIQGEPIQRRVLGLVLDQIFLWLLLSKAIIYYYKYF